MSVPTLIVGIGGMGGDIVSRLADRIDHEQQAGNSNLTNVAMVVMDTDVNDLRERKERHPEIYTVQTSPKGTVAKALDLNEYARERWFPVNDGLSGKPFTEGAGQVRAVSRLALDYAIEQGRMENLEKAIAKLRGLSGEDLRQEMRIIITGSIAGGTGSGLVLPVAMYIRNFLITRYQDNSAIIRGFFLEPDVVFGRCIDEDERNAQRANAYAAVRELDAFFRKEYSGASSEYKHIVFNAPQPGLGQRIDYPNILPYHFVFLMDALNANGDSLTDVEGRYDLTAYKQHAADCIYAQALSAVSARSNSSEDNVIRKLAANSGRSRYCGAGSSTLEYPKDDVQKYIALSWAYDNVSEEWLEIDNEYNRRLRDEPNLNRSRFYRTEYESKRGSDNSFYKTIMMRSERKDKNGERVDAVEQYIDNLIAHAEVWAENDLVSESVALRRCLFDDSGNPAMRPLPSSADAIQEQCSEDDDPEGLMQAMIGGFFDKVKYYSSVSQEEVPDLARSFARSTFSISDYEENPLKNRNKDWQIESVFRVEENGESGSFHPAAVRYMLYRLENLLTEKGNEARSDAEDARSQMQAAERADYYGETEEVEDPSEAVGNIFSEDGKKRKFPISIPKFGGKNVGEDEAEYLASITNRLNKYRKAVDNFVKYTVVSSFIESARVYVQNLSAAYEDFYGHMGKEIERIHAELIDIETRQVYNNPKGVAHRYVCASSECLKAMKQRCVKKGNSGDLPTELCGDIYKSLLRYAKKRADAGSNYAARTSMSAELFARLFKEVIVDYWVQGVVDPHIGYPAVIDKGIIRAIADEALYTTDKTFFNKDDEVAYTLNHIRDTLKEARELSTPFIEPPTGETPRHIDICAYCEDGLSDVIGCADTVRQLLDSTYGATRAEDGEFSKYQILFYRSLYGFCATNLPKYSPEHKGVEKRPAGEYYRAYFSLVNQLSPNLRDNKLITPHIDKNWHLICMLPDLNEDNERAIQNKTVHAFLHGLIFRKFGAERVEDGDDVYYLTASSTRSRMNLWVSNGTPCDRFYEVFDALEFSPPVVQLLTESSKTRLQTETNSTMALALDKCELIRAIRSKAFKNISLNQWPEQIISNINNFENAKIDIPVNVELCDDGGGRLLSTSVTDLFSLGHVEGDKRRTSIFEIPLLYRISLPQCELREGKVDMMVEGIFAAVEQHLANFCEGGDLLANCCQLFEEQYLLFEHNLVGYEKVFNNVCFNPVVSVVREKILAYVERMPSRHARVEKTQAAIQTAWRGHKEKR